MVSKRDPHYYVSSLQGLSGNRRKTAFCLLFALHHLSNFFLPQASRTFHEKGS
jgi:hypothetical protein